jgi:hypothetical protein
MAASIGEWNASCDETVPPPVRRATKSCLGKDKRAMYCIFVYIAQGGNALMETSAKPIAIVQGANSTAIQELLRSFAARVSARVVGVLEEACDGAERACGPGRLLSLADGQGYSLFQELGEGSVACSLDPQGVVLAGEAVRRDVARGCDLVLLSKFGKLEAENRAGLMAAFVAAIEAGVPVLTSVSPKFTDAFDAFAAPFYTALPAEAEAIDAWWKAVCNAVPLLYAV